MHVLAKWQGKQQDNSCSIRCYCVSKETRLALAFMVKLSQDTFTLKEWDDFNPEDSYGTGIKKIP